MSKNKKPANNIVLFPPSRVVNPTKSAFRSEEVPKTLEQITDATNTLKIKRIDKLMEEILPFVSQLFISKGIILNRQEEMKHCAFMIETIRSILCLHFGVKHPFQELTESIFHQDENGVITVKEVEIKHLSANGGANT